MEVAIDTRAYAQPGATEQGRALSFSTREYPRFPNFEAAAFGTTVEADHATLTFTMPAPLFRGQPPAEHSLVFITDRMSGQRFAVDVIATGGTRIFSDTRPGGNPLLRGLDRARTFVFETLQGEESLRETPTMSIVTGPEAIRLLDTGRQSEFEDRLSYSSYGKTLVVRTALRYGAGPEEVISPDQAASPEAIRRGLQDLTATINSPLTRRQLRSLTIPDIREQFRHRIMELPGGYQVFEARPIQRGEQEMLLYPVTMKRLLATGEIQTEYFEILTKQPLSELMQQTDITLGIESFCTCMNTGGRGCNCYAQVEPRIQQSDAVIYGLFQTDLGYGELSRVLIDRIRQRNISLETGLPRESTEDARHALFGLPEGTVIPDLREHDDSAMLAANLFKRAASPEGSLTLTTSNIAKGKAFARRFMNIHFEESPHDHNILTDHERELEERRRVRADTPYVRRAQAN